MAHNSNSDDFSASYSSSYYSSEEYSSVESNSSMNSSTSKLRTPYHDKATNTSKRDDMYAALKAELKGALVIVEDSDDAFNKFLVAVYGITQKDIDYVKTKSGGWTLDAGCLATFKNLLSLKKHEKHLYAPFKGMVDALFATMTEDEYLIDVQLVTLGDTQLRCPYSRNRRKPDGLFLPLSYNPETKPTWDIAKAYLEMYKSRSAPDVNPLSLGQAASAQSSTGPSTAATASKSSTGTRMPKVGASTVSQNKARAKTTKKSQPSRASASKPSAKNSLRRSERSHTTTPSGRLLMSIGSIIEEEGEDSDDEEDEDDDEDYGSKTSAAGSKRSRKSKNAPNKRPNIGTQLKVCQSASYALESFSSTPRRWATGLLVRDSAIGVHYYDRCGGIVTPWFDFVERPDRFALLLLALGKASLTQAGYDPYFVPADSSSLGSTLPSITDGCLLIPPSDKIDTETKLYTGSNRPDDSWSRFSINEDPLYVYRGLNGRGSIVWPGRWTPDSAEGREPSAVCDATSEATGEEPADSSDGPASCDEMTEAHEPHSLVGSEPSAVDLAPETPTTAPASEEAEGADGSDSAATDAAASSDNEVPPHVVKLSWPSVGRPMHEPVIIQHLFAKIPPSMHDHLPKVQTSAILTAEIAGLPRAYLINEAVGDFKGQFQMGIRHFTIMVGERYEHLWNVKTVAEFEDLYVDIVECHWYAYRYAGILHRDLSENNLMFRRKNGRVFGVVIDWDLASPFNKASDPRNGLTGTGPFMARDILLSKNETIGHLYRHDLESLFYVLIWGACHYVLGDSSKKVRSPAVLAQWLGDFVSAAGCKHLFITDDNWRDDVFNVVVFKDTSIIDRWLRPVWDLFWKAHMAKVGGGIDLSLSLTFDAYMTALNRQPRLPTADYPLPPESSFT